MELRDLILLKLIKGGASLIEKTATGNPASFTTQVAKKLKSLLIPLTYSQEGSGDPSPDNIRPISGVSSLSAYRTGVNVFDEVFEDGKLDSTGQNQQSSVNIRSKNYISVVPGEKYYFKYTTVSSGTNLRLFFYYKDKTYKSNQWTGVTSVSIPSDVYYVRFYMDESYSASGNRKISINYPYTETDYVPYNGTKLDAVFPVDVGTVYGGSLDLVSGVLTLTHKMQTITGEEQVTYSVYRDSLYCGSDIFLSDSKQGLTIYGYSSIVPCSYNGSINGQYIKKSYDDRGIQFYQVMEWWGLSEATQSALEAKLQEWNANGTPLQVVYELETPITVQLTPNQINAIKGNNTVWTDTSEDLTVTYYDKQ